MNNEAINNVYSILQEELENPPSIEKVLFLTGFIQAARATIGYSVPEIENAFLFIRRKLGKGEMEWLKMCRCHIRCLKLLYVRSSLHNSRQQYAIWYEKS